MRFYRATPILALCCTLFSCSLRTVRPVRLTTPCSTASVRVGELWRMLDESRQTPGGCDRDNGMRCDVLQAQIEQVALDCPNNPEAMMAGALLAFERHAYVKAQQLLDELFSIRSGDAEAAALRARISMEEGNMQFALRFLAQQISQNGSDFYLRETYASALYLVGRWEEARKQLGIARRLGAPGWRVAYSQGLIEEATGNLPIARLQYEEALRQKPGWPRAESRLQALIATGNER